VEAVAGFPLTNAVAVVVADPSVTLVARVVKAAETVAPGATSAKLLEPHVVPITIFAAKAFGFVTVAVTTIFPATQRVVEVVVTAIAGVESVTGPTEAEAVAGVHCGFAAVTATEIVAPRSAAVSV
jgi:hypothetical protein